MKKIIIPLITLLSITSCDLFNRPTSSSSQDDNPFSMNSTTDDTTSDTTTGFSSEDYTSSDSTTVEDITSEFTTTEDDTSLTSDDTSITSEEDSTSSGLTLQEQKDKLLHDLHVETRTAHKKLLPYSGTSKHAWFYFLALDRDYELSPLKSTESISAMTWDLTGIWLRPLYTNSPIYLEAGVNNGGSYKYYDTNGTLQSGTFGGGVQFDREHVFPKSYGFNDSSAYASYVSGTDVHNLHIGESKNNQNGHNNYYYGNVTNKATATKITDNFTGVVTGWMQADNKGKNIYEPRDEDKGDIARSLFYMATRYAEYETKSPISKRSEPALALTNDTSNWISSTIATADTLNSAAKYGRLDDLLDWNHLDPVDEFEETRNDNVEILQGNRNPYVDNETYAEFIFGDAEDYQEDPNALLSKRKHLSDSELDNIPLSYQEEILNNDKEYWVIDSYPSKSYYHKSELEELSNITDLNPENLTKLEEILDGMVVTSYYRDTTTDPISIGKRTLDKSIGEYTIATTAMTGAELTENSYCMSTLTPFAGYFATNPGKDIDSIILQSPVFPLIVTSNDADLTNLDTEYMIEGTDIEKDLYLYGDLEINNSDYKSSLNLQTVNSLTGEKTPTNLDDFNVVTLPPYSYANSIGQFPVFVMPSFTNGSRTTFPKPALIKHYVKELPADTTVQFEVISKPQASTVKPNQPFLLKGLSIGIKVASTSESLSIVTPLSSMFDKLLYQLSYLDTNGSRYSISDLHVFSKVGTYTIDVTKTSSTDNIAATSFTIEVKEADIPSVEPGNTDPDNFDRVLFISLIFGAIAVLGAIAVVVVHVVGKSLKRKKK